MNLTESYIKFISVCDKHMLRHEYKEAFLVLTQVKYWIEKENDPTFDNDFNSRAAFCALLFGQPEEALRLTEMVNLNTPGYLLVQAFRGWALKEIGYQKRANVLFNYVLSMAPDTDSVMDCLGAAISSKLIGSELSKVFFEFTIEKFGTLTGSDRQLNLIWGIFAYLKKSELETVQADNQLILLKSLELTKDSADLYDYLGQTYYAMKKYDLALKCYLKSIELSPYCNFYRHIKVSFIYFYTGREEQAKTFVLRFLGYSRDLYIFYWILCPSIQLMKSNEHSDFEKFYRTGLLLYYSQVYYSSYIMLQKAKEFDPFNYKLCIFMCIVQRYLGLLDEGIKNLEELKENKYQNDIPLNIILAELYTVTQNYAKAEEMYKKIIELTPNKSFSIYIFVKFLNKMNRLDDSLLWIQKAIDLEPKKVKLLIMKALIYSSQKQLDKAYETYEEVLKINPNLQSTKYQLSQINYVMNNYQKSFDQMVQIKEGEVGYERCINLLVKLFISFPDQLTKEQLEYANTHLRDRITHHLRTLGESSKKSKNQTQKQNKKEQDLESKNKKKSNEQEINFSSSNKEEEDEKQQEQDKSKNNNKKNNKKGKKGGKNKLAASKAVKKVSEELEIEEEEQGYDKKQLDNDDEEEEEEIDEINNKNVKKGKKEKEENEEEEEEEEIELEKDGQQVEEKNKEQQQAEEETDDYEAQGIEDEREIQRLLDGQSDSLSDLDEINLDINESLTSPSPNTSQHKTEDCYQEYLQKIKEENIKDKQIIYEDYSNYFHKNQQSYSRLLKQAKKVKLSALFEGNDIDEILAEELKKIKNQNNNEEDNNQIQIEENNQDAEGEQIPIENNNAEQQQNGAEENHQDKQSQIESEQERKPKKKAVSKKTKKQIMVKSKSKPLIRRSSSRTNKCKQSEKKSVKKVKKAISKGKESISKKKTKDSKLNTKKIQKNEADLKVRLKQKNQKKIETKSQNNGKLKNSKNEDDSQISKKNKIKAQSKLAAVNNLKKKVVFRKTRSSVLAKNTNSDQKVKSSSFETDKQVKQNEKANTQQKSKQKARVSVLQNLQKKEEKQTKVSLRQIKDKKKTIKKAEILKKPIKKDTNKRTLRSSTKNNKKS